MIVIQVTSLGYYIFSYGINRANKIPTFNKCIDAYGFWAIEIFLFFFMLGCLSLEVLDPKENKYEAPVQENVISITMILMAIATLFLEIMRAVLNIVSSF